jgi:hypothetical protein
MFRWLLWAIAAAVRPKVLLIADNLCLRQQLLVLHRRKPNHGHALRMPTGVSSLLDALWDSFYARSSRPQPNVPIRLDWCNWDLLVQRAGVDLPGWRLRGTPRPRFRVPRASD